MARTRLQRKFGRAIRARRQAAGISQETLADHAGVHRTYVSMLERGVGNPSLTVIAALAGALDTPISSLFLEVEQARS